MDVGFCLVAILSSLYCRPLSYDYFILHLRNEVDSIREQYLISDDPRGAYYNSFAECQHRMVKAKNKWFVHLLLIALVHTRWSQTHLCFVFFDSLNRLIFIEWHLFGDIFSIKYEFMMWFLLSIFFFRSSGRYAWNDSSFDCFVDVKVQRQNVNKYTIFLIIRIDEWARFSLFCFACHTYSLFIFRIESQI